MKKLDKLLLIGFAGLIPCFGVGYIFQKKAENLIRNSTLYQEAMDIFKHHKGAIYFLGQPVQELGVQFNNFGLTFDNYSEVKVKVSGPKEKGILFVKVKRDEEEQLFLESILLQIGKDDSKRLVIKNTSEENNSDTKQT